MFLLRISLLLIGGHAWHVLQNELLAANVTSGLHSLLDKQTSTEVQLDDTWQLQLTTSGLALRLGPEVCKLKSTAKSESSVILQWQCDTTGRTTTQFNVNVSYSLKPGHRFVAKSLRISSSAPAFQISHVNLWNASLLSAGMCSDLLVHRNPQYTAADIVAVSRFKGISLFASITNPFFNFDDVPTNQSSCLQLLAGYAPLMEHNSSFPEDFHQTDDGVIGFSARGKHQYPDGLYIGEKAGFKACTDAYMLDEGSRRNRTLKVNVAWDESDYQIDVGTAAGIDEYKRIIDRNAQLGTEYIVYEPQNSLHSSRLNTTDGWGWEMSLWFSMGEQLRRGLWNPQKDAVPADILEMVNFAKSKNIKLLAYVYPCLAFQEVKQYEFGTYNVLDLSQPPAAEWLVETLSAFKAKSGAGGFSWDHDIMTHPARSYAQWRAWMRILRTLRERFPDIVMDHRQQNHMYGPWYQMAGSYAEPLGSDENPETYGVRIPSLHADHVAADQLRSINYGYAVQQMLPAVRVPGFMFHQSERNAPAGDTPCEGATKDCYSWNARDFDLLGYKYSVISNVATAGLNNVLTMIPARDQAEFSLFPEEDVDFIRSWVAWTDVNVETLRHAAPISSLPPPGIGVVDGWHAMNPDDVGYVFLFNPNFRKMNVTFVLDESVGISNASVNSSWIAMELFPNAKRRPRGPWHHGQKVAVEVEGSNALVLHLQKSADSLQVHMVGWGATGEAARVSAKAKELQSMKCEETRPDTEEVDIVFAGPKIYHAMAISSRFVPQPYCDTWFNTSFVVPIAIKEQLKARAERYPVPWTSHDLSATWLAPERLLMTVYMGKPSFTEPPRMWIDGSEVQLQKASNSRDAKSNRSSKTFTGYYFDASLLHVDISHELALALTPVSKSKSAVEALAFQGVFWENIETVYTADIASCTAVAQQMEVVI